MKEKRICDVCKEPMFNSFAGEWINGKFVYIHEKCKFKRKEKKIKELHGLVVTGIVNGLSHTHKDGRLDDINFWRSRCELFNLFSLCVLDIVTNQNYKYSEKELKEIAEEGYKK